MELVSHSPPLETSSPAHGNDIFPLATDHQPPNDHDYEPIDHQFESNEPQHKDSGSGSEASDTRVIDYLTGGLDPSDHEQDYTDPYYGSSSTLHEDRVSLSHLNHQIDIESTWLVPCPRAIGTPRIQSFPMESLLERKGFGAAEKEEMIFPPHFLCTFQTPNHGKDTNGK